jgi:rhodanese-related sulfurtransferase
MAYRANKLLTMNTTLNAIDLRGSEFKQAFEGDAHAVLLDVRTAGEVAEGALPGAQHLDFFDYDFMEKATQLDKSKTYYLYCRSGNRSAQACHFMAAKGFKVHNLVGGIMAWPA